MGKSKVGDTAPNMVADTNANLTGASATIKVRNASTGTQVISRSATITDAPNGIVDGGDASTLALGAYQWHIVVTFSGGEIQTFPQSSFLEWLVEPAIS